MSLLAPYRGNAVDYRAPLDGQLENAPILHFEDSRGQRWATTKQVARTAAERLALIYASLPEGDR